MEIAYFAYRFECEILQTIYVEKGDNFYENNSYFQHTIEDPSYSNKIRIIQLHLTMLGNIEKHRNPEY